MKKNFWIFFTSFLLVAVLPSKTFAAAPTINNFPSSISLDSEFIISVSMDGLSSNSIYRLRIAFAKTGTTNYFGSTFNGADWYNGTPSPINYSEFLSVTTDSNGSWQGDIKGKIELSDPNFKTGSGTYDVKIGRYTENGTSATWSNMVQISLIAPSSTPTSTPSPSPQPTNTPTPTLKPTITSKPPTLTPTLKPNPTKSPTPTNKITTLVSPAALVTPTKVIPKITQAILGDKISTLSAILSITPTKPIPPTKKATDVKTLAEQKINPGGIFIMAGVIFLIACGILVFLKFRNKKEEIV